MLLELSQNLCLLSSLLFKVISLSFLFFKLGKNVLYYLYDQTYRPTLTFSCNAK